MEPNKNLLYIAVTLIFVIQCALAQLTLIVSKDGLGNFTTITTQAVAAAPNHSSGRTTIKIKAGIYYENIIISPQKVNLSFIGEGMDTTKISGNKSAKMGLRTQDTATVQIFADGFVARYITFENTAGPKMFQAVALSNYGNHTAFYRCRFLGYQDTLNPQSRTQFYRDCEVYGTVDFIFGVAKVLFQNCNIYARKPLAGQSNTITAQGNEEPHYDSGTVMQNCSISATPDLQKDLSVKTFLGRPWKNHSTTVIVQSYLDKLIDPRGWLEWKGVSLDNVYYVEYNNRGPGASTHQRVKWSHVINSRAEAAKFTVRNFIDGEKWIKSIGIPYYPDLL